MLEAIFGSKVRESALIYLAGRDKGYAREIAAYYKFSWRDNFFSMQKKLFLDNIIKLYFLWRPAHRKEEVFNEEKRDLERWHQS